MPGAQIELERGAGSFPHARVVVVGDVMLDRYIYGSVSRVSPEAPVLVLNVTRETAMPGGAGNVVRNLTALEATSTLVSVVGEDYAGSEIAELIRADRRVEPWLLSQNGRKTTIKTRYIANGQHLVRTDREDLSVLPEWIAEKLVRVATDALRQCQIMVLSDYNKGVLSADVSPRLIAAAKHFKRPVIVDPKGHDYSRYAGADVITPNRKELYEATNMPVDTEMAIVNAARSLLKRFAFGAVIVTRSEDGMTLLTKDLIQHFPAEAPEVFDVSGAGDTVVATLAAALAANATIPNAVQLSNIAGGIAVGKVGTSVSHRAEILSVLNPITGTLKKIVTAAAAAEAANRWRARGWKIGFTNGCFDLLHPGHVHLLEQARSVCDRLIVGLNADQSISRLKGPGRPVQPEAARAAVVASLESVELVTIFEEETPLDILRLIKPDILVKGEDYTRATVVGAKEVESWGGEVMLAKLLDGHSTTKMVSRLKEEFAFTR